MLATRVQIWRCPLPMNRTRTALLSPALSSLRTCLALQNSPGALVVNQTPARNPEGCQTVAGGRSVAQTPGKGREAAAPRRGARGRDHVKKGNELLEGRTEARRSKLFELIEPAVGENGLAVLPLPRLFGTVFLASSAFWHPSRVRFILSLFRGSALRSDPRLLSANLPGWAGRSATRQVRTLNTYVPPGQRGTWVQDAKHVPERKRFSRSRHA